MANAATTTRKARPAGKATFQTRLRYRFDNAMARGPFVVIAYLAGVSFAVMMVAALIAAAADLTFAGGAGDNFGEDLWQAMLRTVDAGSFAADTQWPTRLLALLVTLAGIFVAGSLIGLIASAVDQKVEELRRGRSTVVEYEHTLILGWSDQVPRIVSELVTANESEKRAAIVILSSADKTEMEETLRDRVPDTKTTRVVCRSGSTASPADLERSAVHHARSIIAVRGEEGDAGVVKAILAVKAINELESTHIVAEIAGVDTAKIIRSSTNGRVLTVSSDDVVAEVTAQACLQAGLSVVFSDLLDFDGDELYFAPVGELAGCSYGEALLAFDRSSVLGRITADDAVELNPPITTTLARDDQLIVVAEDDSAVAFTGIKTYDIPKLRRKPAPAARTGLEVVLVGWSTFGRKVLKELDEFLPSRSKVTVVIDGDLVDTSELAGIKLRHATLDVIVGDGGPDDFRSLVDGKPKRVIVLGYRDALSVDEADARTLLTLLALRSQWPAGGNHGVRIVAELLDQRNLVLAVPVGVDDLIVSNALASLLMAQLAEHPALLTVFDDLFDADGAIIEMRSAASLVPADPIAFGSVVAAGAAAGVSVFGYRKGATGAVTVNPSKVDIVTLGPDDDVAVVAIA